MREDNDAQMLLATGIVLMLSLLTMAWFGVSVAGLGDPYDPGTEEVIEVAETLSEVWQPLIENRSTIFVNEGHDWEESVNAAANSTANDLMRHGEHRGVEIIITPSIGSARIARILSEPPYLPSPSPCNTISCRLDRTESP